jgi:hypothetical protein
MAGSDIASLSLRLRPVSPQGFEPDRDGIMRRIDGFVFARDARLRRPVRLAKLGGESIP